MTGPADEHRAPAGVALYLPGVRRGEHTFHIVVEESSGSVALLRGETVEQPWLRAACSCGWRAEDDQRTTIEENSHWRWLHFHVQPKEAASGNARSEADDRG